MSGFLLIQAYKWAKNNKDEHLFVFIVLFKVSIEIDD
jgi:hypothetical protein